MENNDDFAQKFNYTKRNRHNSFSTTILTSFISAVIGGSCALGIYTGINKSTQQTTAVKNFSNSNSKYENLNLAQVSLNNYSDTAVFAANKALPSMVSISVEYEVSYMGRTQVAYGSGSGVILSSDGYILTNNHVISSSDASSFYTVSDATAVTVSIYGDDTKYPAKIVGSDSQTDLAVLKINRSGLTPADLGDSNSTLVGEFVLAIGNPYGLEHSVTAGIVSALNRKMSLDGVMYKVIQADCAINSGNSGGALVNSQGQVIGITTLKLAGTGIEGVSFAIPINDTIKIYEELIKNGKIIRPLVGISGINVDEKAAVQNGLKVGIYIDSIILGSPAQKAGLQQGDIIVKFDNKNVATMEEFNEIKNSKKIGDNVEISFYRENQLQTVTVTLGEN